MKTKNIIIFIIIQLLFTQFLFAQNNLNEEYLEKDLQIFTNFLPILESGEFDLTTLMKINDIRISDEYGNLGLGYNKTAYHLTGGYTVITTRLLLNPDNLIIKYRINISYHNINVFNVLNERLNLYYLLSHYKENRIYDYIIFELEETNEELFSEMMSCFHEYFGINGEVVIPSAISNDYSLLTDPFNEDIYGHIVGYVASVPSFRSAIERIKKEKNNDILVLIMASPNPTGRIYAIEAISNGNVNNIKKNRRYSNILNRIYKLKIPIEAGAGCIVFSITIDSNKKLTEAMNYTGFPNEDEYGDEIKSNENVYIIIIGGIIGIIGIGVGLLINRKTPHFA
ncbi:MAG: hypothetical protein LBI28_13615 [Treponema sp.]|jgi:hypothetical protein|nr:hypothetical protein [Treponema sp.]